MSTSVLNNPELYQQCVTFLQQNILDLAQSPDSIMNLDCASDFKFVADAKSGHGVFANSDGTTVKSIRAIGQLGKDQMLNPYFTLSARDKQGVSCLPLHFIF